MVNIRVIGPDSLPISGVEVALSGANELRRTTTGKTGEAKALLVNQTSSFFIGLRRVGYQPIAWRYNIAPGRQAVSIDTLMATTPVTLPEISVLASRVEAPRIAKQIPVQSGSFSGISPTSLLTDVAGDPQAWLALMTQLIVGDSGAQVLGSAPGQAAVTLDGMRSDAGSVPPDAFGGALLLVNSTDVSQSGFTGPQLNLATQHGNDNFSSTLRMGYTDPAVAWSDPLSSLRPVRTLNSSGFLSGPIRRGSAYYRLSFVHSIESNAALGLLDQSPSQLGQWGLAPDSVTRLTEILGNLGALPTSSGVTRDTRSLGSAILNVDFQPSSVSNLTITLYPSWSRRENTSGGTFSFPGSGRIAATDQWQLLVQETSPFLGGLNTLKLSGNTISMRNSPTTQGTTGTVMVGITPERGFLGNLPLSFGGGGRLDSSRQNSLELKNEWSRSLGGGRHRFRLGQSWQLESIEKQGGIDQCGYQFASMEQLAASRPDRYLCNFGGSTAKGRSVAAGLYVLDSWRTSDRLGISGGLRVDYQGYGPTMTANPAVAADFGLTTGAPVSAWTISPRIGFAWEASTKGHANWYRVPGSNLLRPAYNAGPDDEIVTTNGTALGAVTVSGTLGAYQGGLAVNRLADELQLNGGMDSKGLLSCLGEAAPLPVWGVNSAPLPDSCRDGSTPLTWSEQARLVQGYASEYRVPRTWRGNLKVSRIYWGIWHISAEVLGAVNQHRESRVDLNRSLSPRFTLADEGQRPVLVNPADIDPGSGWIAPAASRLDSRYGAVTELRSDLQNRSAQLRVTASTQRILGIAPLSVEYVLNRQWSQERGLESDPELVAWYNTPVPTHRFLISSQGLRVWWFNLHAQMTLSSGTRFTPRVDRDINGDGRGGDPAFVFDPAATADPQLREGILGLLADAPARVRNCLESQLGQVAAVYSCRGAWNTRLDLDLKFDPPMFFGLGERTRLGFRLLNAGAAFSRLFGLDPQSLGGMTSSPDPTLLRVRGFDSATNRYHYEVNPLFGRPYPNLLGSGSTPPFQIQFTAEVALGNLNKGGLDLIKYFRLERGLNESQIRERLRERLAPDPVAGILVLGDSLSLSPKQQTGVEAVQAQFNLQVEQALDPMVEMIMREGDNLSNAPLMVWSSTVSRITTKLILDARAQAEKLLEEGQLWILHRLEGQRSEGN